jgi:hypothetical protein
MKAIRKEVGKPAEVIDLDMTYEFQRATVGGYIQMVPIGPGVEVVCNEEGMFAGPGGTPLPQNAAGYLGNILIVAVDPDEGECIDMTPEQLRKGLAYLERYAELKHDLSGGVGIIVGKANVDAFLLGKATHEQSIWDTL